MRNRLEPRHVIKPGETGINKKKKKKVVLQRKNQFKLLKHMLMTSIP